MVDRSSLVAVLLTLLVAAPALAQVVKQEFPGIRNFSRVDATVGCGGATDPSAMADLRAQGFLSVVNLRLASEPGADVNAGRAAAEAAGMRYIHLPFDTSAPDDAIVDQFLDAVSDPTNQPVYIHCGSANRVGGLWMVKRVLGDGWEMDRARTEAEAIGLRSPAILEFVTGYINARR